MIFIKKMGRSSHNEETFLVSAPGYNIIFKLYLNIRKNYN